MEHALEKAVVKIFQKKRKELGMTQEDLSKLVSTSSKTIYRLENNYTSLSFFLFVRICNVFKTNPSSVIEEAKATFSPIENTPVSLKPDVEEQPSNSFHDAYHASMKDYLNRHNKKDE